MPRYLLAALAMLAPITAHAQLDYPPKPVDITPATTAAATAQAKADAAQVKADAAQARADAAIAAIPAPATTMPPGVSDSGSIGTQTTIYALANHTHASKARKGRVTVPVVGGAVFADVTYSAAFTGGGTPVCAVTAETAPGDTSVVNAQIDGTPTSTGMRIRITRSTVTAVSLLGLSVLSVPSQTATVAHYVCLEP